MAKFCEGNRVVDFVAGVTAIEAAAFLNEFQDQLKTMLTARKYPIPLGLYFNEDTFWVLDDETGGNPMRWEEEFHTASSLLFVPVYLPAGSVITAVTAYIKGASTETGGDISLFRQKVNGSATRVLVQAIDATDPWAHDAITEKTASGMTHTVDGDYNYYFVFENATANIADNYVYGCIVTAQFGN